VGLNYKDQRAEGPKHGLERLGRPHTVIPVFMSKAALGFDLGVGYGAFTGIRLYHWWLDGRLLASPRGRGEQAGVGKKTLTSLIIEPGGGQYSMTIYFNSKLFTACIRQWGGQALLIVLARRAAAFNSGKCATFNNFDTEEKTAAEVPGHRITEAACCPTRCQNQNICRL